VTDTLTAHGRGTTVEYTVFVTNTGNTTDTINLYVLSSDWTVDVPINVGPLGRGESTVVVITVTVPSDISMGDSNLATIAFISQGNPMQGLQVPLTTNTFWYSTYLPLSQKQ